MNSPHPDTDRLRAFSLGLLDAAELEPLEDHLDQCSSCCETLEECSNNGLADRLHDAFKFKESGTMSLGNETEEDSIDTIAASASARKKLTSRKSLPSIPGYEIRGELGRGGMGVVYEARHIGLNRYVALKTLAAGRQTNPDDVVRFRVEAESLARLHHPCIVQVYDVGNNDGLPFFAMELLKGGSLQDRLQHGPLEAKEAAHLVEALARAVGAAHEKGIIHRDLKPANVLFSGSGYSNTASALNNQSFAFHPKITDFGLAKWMDGDIGLTQTGTVAGTPAYMAPEQAAGEVKELGPKVDIYALGAILYATLTGRPPFQGNSPLALLKQVRNTEPVAPSRILAGIPVDPETICLKCLEKDPRRRYRSANELAEELQRFLRGEPIRARQVSRLEHAWRWCRRNPVVASLIFTCCLIFATGFAGVTWKWTESSVNLQRAIAAKKTAKINEEAAEREEKKAIQANLSLQKQTSQLLFDKGWKLCSDGKVEVGIQCMAESLKIAPNRKESEDWRRVIRINLCGWGRFLNPIRHQVEFKELKAVNDWTDQNVTYCRYSPNGKLCVSGTIGGWIYCMKVPSGEKVGKRLSLNLPQKGWSMVRGIAFHPRESWCLAGGGVTVSQNPIPGVVLKIDTDTFKPIGQPMIFPYCVRDVQISPDGKLCAIASCNSRNGFVVVRQISSEQVVCKIDSIRGQYIHLHFSSDNRYMHILERNSNRKTRYKLVDLNNEKCKPQLIDSKNGITQRRLSDRTEVFIGEDLPAIFFEYSISDKDFDEYYSPNSGESNLAQIRKRSRPGVAKADTKKIMRPVSLRSVDTLLSDRQDMVLVFHKKQFVHLIDVKQRTLITEPIKHLDGQPVFAISPDSKRFAMSGPSFAQVFDVHSGQPISPVLKHPNVVSALAFSPDGKRLAVGDYSMNVQLWEVDTGIKIGPVMKQRDIVLSVAFSPDGKKLAAGTAHDWNHEPQARLWNLETYQPIGQPMRHDHYVPWLQFSADGSRLLTISRDSTARVWETATANPVSTISHQGASKFRAIFSQDGKRVLTGTGEGEVSGWDATTGTPLPGARVDGPSQVTAFAFSNNASRFAVGYRDGTSQLFDTKTFKPLGPPVKQGAMVCEIFLAPDGESWTTILTDGMTRTWQAPQPLVGAPDDILRMFRIYTALKIDENQMPIPMELYKWKSLRERVSHSEVYQKGIPQPRKIDWFKSRALDYEENGQWYEARKHLRILMKLTPKTWSVYARRAHVNVQLKEYTLARELYSKAEKILADSGEARRLILWFRQQVIASRHQNNPVVEAWYLNRLTELEAENN